MKHLIQFPLKNGNDILIEVQDSSLEPSFESMSPPKEIIAHAEQTLESALANIKPAAEAIVSHLTTLTMPPSELEVEFGLKFSAEAGAFIASGKAEANYTVRLKWVQEKPSK